MAVALKDASQGGKVLLGFADEFMRSEKEDKVDFATSKIGGRPFYPADVASRLYGDETLVTCGLCRERCSLVTQIYAPLEHSSFHRTLYVFACLTPTCWNQSDSWRCLRVQTPDVTFNPTLPSQKPAKIAPSIPAPELSSGLFAECDDWGDGDDDFGVGRPKQTWPQSPELGLKRGSAVEEEEENGNMVETASDSKMQDSVTSIDNRSSSSLSTSTTSDFSELLTTPSPTPNANINANMGAAGVAAGAGAAAPKISSSSAQSGNGGATAEIEPQEAGDVVVAVENAPTPSDLGATIPGLFAPSVLDNCKQKRRQNANACEFAPCWLFVQEETFTSSGSGSAPEHALTDHERELLLEYKMKESKLSDEKAIGGAVGGGKDADGYEKVLPKHGDAFFHKMKTVIEENPGQVLRYSRDTEPLLLARQKTPPASIRCTHCRGPTLCELQLLSTLIPSLELRGGSMYDEAPSALEFGTVLIYTCQESCWVGGKRDFCTEKVIVQAEVI